MFYFFYVVCMIFSTSEGGDYEFPTTLILKEEKIRLEIEDRVKFLGKEDFFSHYER